MTLWHQIWTLAFAVGVIGNLIASVIWAVPAFLHLHRKMNRHHAEHLAFLRKAGTMVLDATEVRKMPYKIRKQEGTDNYEVINADTEEVKAVHEPPDAKEKAEKQVHLLHAVENDPGWEPSE